MTKLYPGRIDFDSIVRLNNAAVAYIRDGNLEQATTVLSNVLSMTKHLMLRSQLEPTLLSPEAKTHYSCILDACMLETLDLPEDFIWLMSSNSKFMMYQSPIRMPADINQASYDSITLTSLIVMFNLALAHHRSAVEEPSHKKRVSLLRKAAKIYELGLHLHSHESRFGSAVYLLACVNNLGVLYQELQQVDTARRCFGHLLKILMMVTTNLNRSCHDNISMLLDGFFQNVSREAYPPCTAEAA